MTDQKFQLEVKHDSLREALKRLAKTVAKRVGEEAVLSFDGANLHIDIGGGCMTVPAKGHFDCQVRVTGKTLLNLAQVLPSGDPIRISVIKDQLQIQNCIIRCKIQQAWSKIVDLPVNLSAKESVPYLSDQSMTDLEASGLAHLAGGLPAAVREAARLLAPYGISAADVERLIQTTNQRPDGDLFGSQ